MTLREQWTENRRRRAAGLPEVDRNGVEIVPRKSTPLSPEAMADLIRRTAESYDPNSPNYRRYQGD